MKLLIVADQRSRWYKKGKEFKVLEMENTVEWAIGDTISKTEMYGILMRQGTNTVKVKIKEPKK